MTQKTGPIDSTGTPASTTTFVSGPDAGGANDTVFKSVTVQGAAYNYFYDALNRRRYKSYPSGISDEYFYDLGHQLLVDQGNSTLAPASAVHLTDEYIWLGGRPVAIVRGNLTSAWAHQADNTGSCARNGDAANCGIYFPVTDVISKAILMLNSSGRVVGTGEYDPFGQVNRVFLDAESAHPYNSATGTFADFTQPVAAGLSLSMRLNIDLLDLDQWTDWAPGASCDNGIVGPGPIDTLNVRNSANTVLLSFNHGSASHQGLLTTAWVQPSDGRLRLSLDGTGHCVGVQGCPGCSPGTQCLDWSTCDPTATCVPQCDTNTQKTQPGAVVGSYEYRRYETGQVPFWTPLRFPGQYYDAESDLFENWNRYFDSAAGRYQQPEPKFSSPNETHMSSQEGHGAPTYAYATNNPVKESDPTGLRPPKRHFDCSSWDGVFVNCARASELFKDDPVGADPEKEFGYCLREYISAWCRKPATRCRDTKHAKCACPAEDESGLFP